MNKKELLEGLGWRSEIHSFPWGDEVHWHKKGDEVTDAHMEEIVRACGLVVLISR